LLNKYIEQGGGSGGSGGISREEVERIIEEYLAKNPPKDGIDGVSPTIETIPIENGTRVSITDKDGTKSFDVLNGVNGYSPIRGIDYWTEADKNEIKTYVEEAILGGSW
jgi:hypothetical protein